MELSRVLRISFRRLQKLIIMVLQLSWQAPQQRAISPPRIDGLAADAERLCHHSDCATWQRWLSPSLLPGLPSGIPALVICMLMIDEPDIARLPRRCAKQAIFAGFLQRVDRYMVGLGYRRDGQYSWHGTGSFPALCCDCNAAQRKCKNAACMMQTA